MQSPRARSRIGNNPPANAHTLFDIIRGTLTQAIASGELKPGDKLPTEQQLAEEFGASRPTVNKAVTSLAHDGLVIRRKRAGTVVLAQSAFWLPVLDASRYVRDRGQSYRHEILSRIEGRIGRDGLSWPELGVGTPVIAMECIHFCDALPIQHERRLINLMTVPEAAEASFDTTPPGLWLLGHVPWSASEHRIGAIGAGERLAALLGVKKGTPCLGVHRVTRHRGTPLTAVTLTSPAGRFFLEGADAPLDDKA